jgi:hypothetical protein
MKTTKDFSKGLVYVLTHMAEMIGVDYNTIDFFEEDWYMKHEWTQEKQDEFVKWLSNEIRTNKEVRHDVTSYNWKPSKKMADKTALAFNLNYGWKTLC